jgi:hypothetical protein
MIFANVASRILNKSFNEKYPHYPAFTDLHQPLTKDNFAGTIASSLKKISSPGQANRNGEAILSGLGLWSGQSIVTDNSKYADSVKRKLKEAGEGAVLNKSDILWCHYAQAKLWYSVEFDIDYQLEFLVLTALAFKGEIEIVWSGNKTVSATNIEAVNSLSEDDLFTFQHVKQPKGINIKSLKMLFTCLDLPDYTSELEKPETVLRIVTEAKTRAEKVVFTKSLISNGLYCRNVALLKDDEVTTMKAQLEKLAQLLDGIQSYNSYGKLKSFRFTEDELKETFEAYKLTHHIEKLREKAEKFEKLIGYLIIAQSYVVQEEKPLFDDMKVAIEELPEIITNGKDMEVKKYEAKLNSLVERYADYYLQQYTRCRLSKHDSLAKERILNGEKKRICDIVKDSEFITATDYQNWINSITSLKEGDTGLTKTKVMQEPYHDFNPREYYGKPSYNIHQLDEQLDEILKKWTDAMQSIFKDPSIQENMDILKSEDKKLVEEFRTGKVQLTATNASRLRDLITQFAQGIDKVEVSIDEFKKHLSKPLTPEEAIQALTNYINSLCVGKERNKVRIVIK